MNPIFIKATTIDDAWFQVLNAIHNHGRNIKVDKGSYEGCYRRQIDHLTLHLTSPLSAPLLPEPPTTKGSVVAPANHDMLEKYISYLFYGDKKENESYTYGERISEQLDETLNILSGGKITNQSTISISRPSDIHLSDPPCLRSISFRMINEKMNMFLNFRSWDAYNGLPLNLAGLAYLFDYVAGEIGFETGELLATSEGCHIYDHVFDMVKELVG